MIEFIKRFCAYFAATLTFLFGIKAAIGDAFSWDWFAVPAGVLILGCALITWSDVIRDPPLEGTKAQPEAEEGSISFAIARALAEARYAARDDESIALLANRIVRRGLDKRCIKYADYKKWRTKNPTVFTAVVSADNQLVGFFDVFPLTDQAADGLKKGTISERSLTVAGITPMSDNVHAKKIYVASVMLNKKQTAYSSIVAKEVVLLKLAEFLATVFPPVPGRVILAYAHTVAGERLLKNSDFRNTALADETRQNDPFYELSAEGYAKLIRRFNAVQQVHGRNVQRKAESA